MVGTHCCIFHWNRNKRFFKTVLTLSLCSARKRITLICFCKEFHLMKVIEKWALLPAQDVSWAKHKPLLHPHHHPNYLSRKVYPGGGGTSGMALPFNHDIMWLCPVREGCGNKRPMSRQRVGTHPGEEAHTQKQEFWNIMGLARVDSWTWPVRVVNPAPGYKESGLCVHTMVWGILNQNSQWSVLWTSSSAILELNASPW